MKITYIIFIITCFASHCFGEDESDGKTVSSSYTYSIEYNDNDHGNFGHKIEVKDGSAKVNVRSENSNKYNTAVASNPGKPYLPQKKAVVFEKPKEEVSYASATESSPVLTVQKNTQSYSVPQVPLQPQKNAAIESALQKYSREQLAILLSQNKNPFLPLDPKDSINKFVSKYITPQPAHHSSVNQPQPNTAYVEQYQTQSYSTSPAVSSNSKSQYPTAYYAPSVSQQNNPVQQTYYKPQVQYTYPQSVTYSNAQQNVVQSYVPQKHTVPATQEPVQYVYVPQNIPQTSSAHSTNLPQSALYGGSQTGPVQFAQQNYQQSAIHQPGQVTYTVPKTVSYPAYSPVGQTPSSAYTNSLPSHYYASQPSIQEKQQYVTVPSSSAYQSNQAVYNVVPKTAGPVPQPTYQNVYGNSLAAQHPSASVPSQQFRSNTVAYKQENQGTTQLSQHNIDFSKYVQYVPTSNQQVPSVTYKPSETNLHTSSNIAQYYSGIPSSANEHIPAVTYKPAETNIHSSSNTAQYYPGKPAPGTASIYGSTLRATETAVQDGSKLQSYSNTGHNIFAQLPSNPNYGSLFSGASPLKYEDALKYSTNSQSSQLGTYSSNVIQGTQHQVINSAGSSTNLKPVVENQNYAPEIGSKLQYQSFNDHANSGLSNLDASKLQFYGTNFVNNNIPSEHNFQLNQVSNVQASDNKYGQYAIDFRQGTSPNGAAQVMVQTNYNLGVQNSQSTHSSVPVSAASDNSNVRYVYVPSYASTSSGESNPVQ